MQKQVMLRLKQVLLCLLCIVNLHGINVAHAHSMVAQHGTVNLVDNHAFLLLSMPASAFLGIDDNKDGLVSLQEFNQHRSAISQDVKQHVYFTTQSTQELTSELASKQKVELKSEFQLEFQSEQTSKSIYIDGLLISPSIAHNQQDNIIDQITVMGRYTLFETTKSEPSEAAHFNLTLFGKEAEERIYKITIIDKKRQLKKTVEVTANTHSIPL